MEGEHALFDLTTAVALVLISLGAFLIPLLCARIRLPAAVGEILYGVVIGPHLMGWVEPTDFVHLVSHLGFFMLMFIAGLELNFRHLERGGLGPLKRGLAVTSLIVVGAFGMAWAVGWPWFTGLVVAAVSIGIPIVLLQETGLGRKPFGQELLLIGSIGEFITILLATGVSAHSAAGGLNFLFVTELLELSLLFFLAYFVLVIFRVAVWWKSETFARVVESHDPSEIGVRAGLALMFLFVAITTWLHVDPILGAFLAGALFSFVFRAKGPLESKFMSLGNGFFIPFFFISVGLDFNLPQALDGNFALLLKLFVALFVVRFVAFSLGLGEEVSLLETAAGALMMSAPLTLLVVIANLGLHLHYIDEVFHATIILLAVISSTVYPFLFKLVSRKLIES